MSNFMNFLDNLDEKIINETYVSDVITDEDDDVVVEEPVKTSKSVKIKKDASVGLVEKRIRTKLDDIGLNEKAISGVVDYVLNGVYNIPDLTTQSQQPTTNISHVNENIPTDIIGRAEFLLDGLSETSYNVNAPSYTNSNDDIGVGGVSSIADHASSLLS